MDWKDIVQAYDVTNHPDVRTGALTKEDATRAFMKSWVRIFCSVSKRVYLLTQRKHTHTHTLTQDKNGDNVVTREEFSEYYHDISAVVDRDDYFELMMRNCWHLSGGEGVSSNTSCRRVLVVFEDDSQKIVEIKNDLGLGSDKSKIMERLKEQGVKGVKRVELTH